MTGQDNQPGQVGRADQRTGVCRHCRQPIRRDGARPGTGIRVHTHRDTHTGTPQISCGYADELGTLAEHAGVLNIGSGNLPAAGGVTIEGGVTVEAKRRILDDRAVEVVRAAGRRRLSWLPGRTVDRNQAITAMTIAQTVAQMQEQGRTRVIDHTHPMRPHIDTWAAELGLTDPAAVSLASTPTWAQPQ